MKRWGLEVVRETQGAIRQQRWAYVVALLSMEMLERIPAAALSSEPTPKRSYVFSSRPTAPPPSPADETAFRRGHALLGLKRYAAAAAAYAQVTGEREALLRHLCRGVALYLDGKWEEAQAEWAAAYRSFPRKARPEEVLSWAQEQICPRAATSFSVPDVHLEAALVFLRLFLERQPEEVEPRLLLAELLSGRAGYLSSPREQLASDFSLGGRDQRCSAAGI